MTTTTRTAPDLLLNTSRRAVINLDVAQGPLAHKTTSRNAQGWATGREADDVMSWPQTVDSRAGELEAIRVQYSAGMNVERVDYANADRSVAVAVWNLRTTPGV